MHMFILFLRSSHPGFRLWPFPSLAPWFLPSPLCWSLHTCTALLVDLHSFKSKLDSELLLQLRFTKLQAHVAGGS